MVDKIKKIRETKNERFKRIAEKRVNVILDKLRVLGQLSEKRNYMYTDSQINQIFKAIDDELRVAKSKLQSDSSERKRFELS